MQNTFSVEGFPMLTCLLIAWTTAFTACAAGLAILMFWAEDLDARAAASAES